MAVAAQTGCSRRRWVIAMTKYGEGGLGADSVPGTELAGFAAA